jgi:medium-chain acyl-[acyl-carrier-protein] hydrolase
MSKQGNESVEPSTTGLNSKWLDSVHHNSLARLRLFCFGHAGSAATFFAEWWRQLPADIEVCPVQLPGRWSRWREEPLRDAATVAKTLIRELRGQFAAKPFAFYGHSLGGLLAYETTVRLREQSYPLPRALLVSGRRPPDAPLYREPLHNLSESALISGLATHYEALDPRLLSDLETKQIVLKVLRADLAMFETYRAPAVAPLDLPVLVFSASNDKSAPPGEMLDWHRFSSHRIQHFTLDGDHFFVRNNEHFLRMLSERLSLL